MIKLIFGLSYAAAVAYVNISIINDTERHRNRNGIRFLMIFCDIIITIIIRSLYNLIVDGVQIEFLGVIRFIFMFLGVASLIIISVQLFSVLKRHSALRHGGNLVLLLDLIIVIVILGLYFVV